jgi:hypothetical protein
MSDSSECVYTKRKVLELRAEVQRLIETGQMPTFAQVLEAVAEARRKYADKIIAARKESERLEAIAQPSVRRS